MWLAEHWHVCLHILDILSICALVLVLQTLSASSTVPPVGGNIWQVYLWVSHKFNWFVFNKADSFRNKTSHFLRVGHWIIHSTDLVKHRTTAACLSTDCIDCLHWMSQSEHSKSISPAVGSSATTWRMSEIEWSINLLSVSCHGTSSVDRITDYN